MNLCPLLYPIRFATLCLLLLTVVTVQYTETFAAALDTDFGDNGKVAVDLGSYGDQANAVLVQPDGKILVSGSTSNTADLDFMLFRLLADGSLDSEFNFDGTVSTAIGTHDDEAFALALQEDGKILAAGYSSNKGSRDFAMARYNSDGSLDRSFGFEGMVVTAVSASDDEITGIAVQEDGKIMLTGTALGDEGRVVVLARYLSNGSPDYTFADEGFALSAVGTDARAESLVLTEEGRILVAGTYQEKENAALMVLGYDANGDLDTSFGYEGVTVPLNGTVPSAGYGLAVRDDGSILVSGSVGESGERDGALFLFGEDGLPDRTFGDKGVLVTEDETDTVFYDVLVTEEMVAATGVTVAENGMRESLLVTYSKEEGGNAEQLFQQQMGGMKKAEDGEIGKSQNSKPAAQVVTTEMDNEEDYTFSLAVADKGSVVVAGASGSQEIASAAVRKYTIFQSSVTDTSSGSATGNIYVLTRAVEEVTRTTAHISGNILSDLGTVSDRGVVFDTVPLPTLDGGDSSSDDTTDDSTSDDSTNDDSTDDSTNDSTDDSTTDETAPRITETNFEPDAPTNGDDVTLTVTTNEKSYCGYSEVYSIDISSYDDMQTFDGLTHKVKLESLTEDTYTYYVGCQDVSGNVMEFPTEIQFEVVATFFYKNSIFFSENQVAFSDPMRASLTSTLETVGNLFVSTAIAQDDTDTTDDSTNDSADTDTEDSDFFEEGNVSKGSGTGHFTAKLEDLKPGTFFYARAYAVVGGTTYYGNQIGFQTADSCFVATAAYGSLFHPAVETLRDFRDRFMLDNPVSRSLVRLYYHYSPPIADEIRNSTVLRPATRALLMPIVGSAWLTMRFGWIWLLLPAAALVLLTWLNMQIMRRKEV
uniref:delta-60 repeat domain-containing protein n=1 Tax=Candidatus Electrothrix sp. TaxID=2170559 RepID=UPI00405617EF